MSGRIDKTELIAKLQKLEGLTNEEKSNLIGLLRQHKKYGLVWEEKQEEVEERLREELPVLTEVKERRIISDAPDAPNHILIEGDNLEALTALSYTHEGKIDVIYIDPPYNRGENDFKYNDKFIDKDNLFRHSLWLSFMRKRLKIAKQLLSPTGVLIAHIDEHEFDALHMLLETEVFNESSNLGVIVWNKLNPKGDPHAVSIMHEYILLFCKNKEAFIQQENTFTIRKPNAQKIIEKAKSLFKKIGTRSIPDEINDILKSYKISKEVKELFMVEYDLETVNNEFSNWLKKSDFKDGEKAYCYIDNNGDCFQPVSMAWPNKETPTDDYFKPLYHPINHEECPVPTKGWRNPSSTMKRLLENGEIVQILPNMVIQGEVVFTTNKKGKNNQPRRKYLLKDNLFENTPSIYNDGSSDDSLLVDLGISFPYPKTLSVAEYLLKSVHPNPSTILDFFAGSGTALHATLELNEKDGGQRKCIIVTNNESNICEEVTYVRCKKVIDGYTTPQGQHVEGLHDNNLRYYRTDFIPRERTQRNMRALVNAATDLLCIKEDLYEEKSTLGTLKLKPQLARYFSDSQKHMLVVYREEVVNELVEAIKTLELGKSMLKIYIFSPGRYAFDDDFYEVQDKVQLVALPAAIYDAYQRVLPKQKERLLDEAEEPAPQPTASAMTIDFEEGGEQ